MEGRAESLLRAPHVGDPGHRRLRHPHDPEGNADHRIPRPAHLLAHGRQALRRREDVAPPHVPLHGGRQDGDRRGGRTATTRASSTTRAIRTARRSTTASGSSSRRSRRFPAGRSSCTTISTSAPTITRRRTRSSTAAGAARRSAAGPSSHPKRQKGNVPAPAATLRAMMRRLVDYAGLFPPAELSMPDATARYASYLHSSDAWMLGRFVVPLRTARRAGRVRRTAVARRRRGVAHQCARRSGRKAGVRIRTFNSAHRGRLMVDVVECRPIARGLRRIDDRFAARARCASSSSFPCRRSEERPAGDPQCRRVGKDSDGRGDGGVISLGARDRALPRASGGIDRAVQSDRGAAPSGVRDLSAHLRGIAATRAHVRIPQRVHGCRLRAGTHARAVARRARRRGARRRDPVLGGVFHLAQHTATTTQIARARASLGLAFGSCSFEEPVAGLRELGLL